MTQKAEGQSTLRKRSEVPELGAKELVKEYKENLILDTATKLFYEKGFQRTTLDDIGAALGVTKPFIYTYFKSKDNILERLFARGYDEVFESVNTFRAHTGKDPVRRFENFVSAYVRKNIELQELPAVLLDEEKNLKPERLAEYRRKLRDFDRLLAQLVTDGVRAGEFEVNNPTIASLAISSMVRWTHRWYSPSGSLSAEEVCAEITLLALRSVGWRGRYVTGPK